MDSKRYLRMDETAVSVRGGTRYLYRAVDKYGKTVDSLLCADRSELSPRKFFTKAAKNPSPTVASRPESRWQRGKSSSVVRAASGESRLAVG
jgi:transposase-like protein